MKQDSEIFDGNAKIHQRGNFCAYIFFVCDDDPMKFKEHKTHVVLDE